MLKRLGETDLLELPHGYPGSGERCWATRVLVVDEPWLALVLRSCVRSRQVPC